MATPPLRALLDCNIWDELAADPEARARVAELHAGGRLEVVISDTLLQELEASPFAGVPPWFPVVQSPDSVFVIGHSRLGAARLGGGDIFTAHRGNSRKVSDAAIVDTADTDADVFVSQDNRARARYAVLRSSGRALDYAEFRSRILAL